MLKLCRVNLEKRQEILEKLDEYVKYLVEHLNPKLVILFGSFTKGDVNEGSDIDLIVLANFTEDFLDRIKKLLDLNKYGIPLEPIGYTPEEFNEMLERKNLFIKEALRTGKILYSTPEYHRLYSRRCF